MTGGTGTQSRSASFTTKAGDSGLMASSSPLVSPLTGILSGRNLTLPKVVLLVNP